MHATSREIGVSATKIVENVEESMGFQKNIYNMGYLCSIFAEKLIYAKNSRFGMFWTCPSIKVNNY
jgi:hypothetical protein